MSEDEKTKWVPNYCRAMSQDMAGLISLAQVLGMSADDVFNAYVKKNEVNFKRQDSGYAVKDHEDSKHI